MYIIIVYGFAAADNKMKINKQPIVIIFFIKTLLR